MPLNAMPTFLALALLAVGVSADEWPKPPPEQDAAPASGDKSAPRENRLEARLPARSSAKIKLYDRGESLEYVYSGIYYYLSLADPKRKNDYEFLQNFTGYSYEVNMDGGFGALLEDYADRWYADRRIPYLTYPEDQRERADIESGDAPSVVLANLPGNSAEKAGLFRTAVVRKGDRTKPILLLSWRFELKVVLKEGKGGKAEVDEEKSYARAAPVFFKTLQKTASWTTVAAVTAPSGLALSADPDLLVGSPDDEKSKALRKKRTTIHEDKDKFEAALKRLKASLAASLEKEKKLMESKE